MGPCPFRHGYRRIIPAVDFQLVKLQWGHALSGMDTANEMNCTMLLALASMGPCPFRHGYWYKPMKLDEIKALQWGHALSGMDTSRISVRYAGPATASMGPCPFRHGYRLNICPDCLDNCLLQWGHALSGMDTAE